MLLKSENVKEFLQQIYDEQSKIHADAECDLIKESEMACDMEIDINN